MMPTAGPYGITQFDAPGIIGAYQDAQQNRIRMMYAQKEIEKLDAEAKRTATTAAAWSKVVGKPPASKAVDAYGTKPEAAPAPSAPADPLAVLPDAQPSPATPAAAPADSPLGQINQQAVPELLSALGPEAGTQFLQHWQQLDDAKKKAVADHNEEIGQALAWADTPEKWDQAVDVLSRQNPQLAQYKGRFEQRGKAALEVGAISSFVKASKPDLMTVGAGQSVIDKNHPEQGPSYTAPADYHQFSVHNADGTDTPYGFDPKTGRAFQLSDGGTPGQAVAGSHDPDTIFNALIQQESGGRPGVTGPPTKYGRSTGLTQLLPSTGKAMAEKLGVPWQPELLTGKTPEAADYQRKLGRAYFDEGMQKYPGDIRSALMYYHGGPDQAQWGPKTHAYADSILRHLGGSSPGSSAPISGKPLAANAGTDETAQFIGGQVALGQPMPPLGMGKEAAAMRRAILAEATKQWKAMGISPGEANVIAAENKSGLAELAKIAQMKATVQTAENTARANAKQILTLMGAAGTTGSPIFNAWQQAGRRATGDTKITALDVAVKTYSTEYARVMSGGNSSVLSDSARHEADALIHTAMTEGQFRSAINQMDIDMANRSKGIEQERQRTLTQIRSGGRAAPQSDEGWKPVAGLPSGFKVREIH